MSIPNRIDTPYSSRTARYESLNRTSKARSAESYRRQRFNKVMSGLFTCIFGTGLVITTVLQSIGGGYANSGPAQGENFANNTHHTTKMADFEQEVWNMEMQEFFAERDAAEQAFAPAPSF